MAFKPYCQQCNTWHTEKEKHRPVKPDDRDEVTRLRALVRDAYNAGFSEGMREVTSSRGGIPWSDCRFKKMLSDDESRNK